MQNPKLTVLHSLLCVLIIILVSILLGCTHEDAVPPVPPPPEDLSTWTVPELVQPPPSVTADALGDAKPTAAEKVYAYTPGTPYQVQVSVGWPLDVVLEHGEQVRNIVGGDRSDNDTRIPQPPRPPAGAQGEGQTTVPSDTPTPAPTNARRLEVREGSEGMGETLRPHIFV